MVFPLRDYKHLIAGDVESPLEGEFTLWTYRWHVVGTPATWTWAQFTVDNKGIVSHFTEWDGNYYRYANGVETVVGAYGEALPSNIYKPNRTVLGKYIVTFDSLGAGANLYVFSIEDLIYTIDVSLDIAGVNEINFVTISPNGQYIAAYVENGSDWVVLYRGS